MERTSIVMHFPEELTKLHSWFKQFAFIILLVMFGFLPSISEAAAPVYDAGVKLKDGSQVLRIYRRVEGNATYDGDFMGNTGYNWANVTSKQTYRADREMCMVAPELVDWNNDGHTDLLVGQADGRIALFINKGVVGHPIFSGFTYLKYLNGEDIYSQDSHAACGCFGGGPPCATPRVVDWNNDGRKDVIVGSWGAVNNGLMAFLNVGTDAAPSFRQIQYCMLCNSLQRSYSGMPYIVDWNGDGILDIVSGDMASTYLSLPNSSLAIYLGKNKKDHSANLYNITTQGFSNIEFGPVTSVLSYIPTDSFDLPGGKVNQGPTISISGVCPVGRRKSVVMAELHGVDGLKDLVIGMQDGTVWYAPNFGTVTSPSFGACTQLDARGVPIIVGDPSKVGQDREYNRPTYANSVNGLDVGNAINEARVAVGDLDGDGLPDLVVGDAGGYVTWFQQHNPNPPIIPSYTVPPDSTPTFSVPSTADTVLAVNFGPSTISVPGYKNDHGALYDSARGYGWDIDITKFGPIVRDSNADPRLDTFVLNLDNGGGWTTSTWTCDLPNGNYFVTVCYGDNLYSGASIDIILQGVSVRAIKTSGKPDAGSPSKSHVTAANIPVTVSNGKLTLKGISSPTRAPLNYIEVRRDYKAWGSGSFVKQDVTTQGTWKGVYGADGYWMPYMPPGVASITKPGWGANMLGIAGASDIIKFPSYALVNAAHQSYDNNDLCGYYNNTTIEDLTSDITALQHPWDGDRIASRWYPSFSGSSPGSFKFDIDFTDGASHRLAMYCLDWKGNATNGVVQTVTVLDAGDKTVLDTQTVSAFQNGIWLVWDIKGHVQIRVTSIGSTKAAYVHGLFFGGASALTSAPVISGVNTISGYTGKAFSYQITASNNPTSYSASGLPLGLTLNPSTGLISGSPLAEGISNVNVSVSNSSGNDSKIIIFNIIGPPVIETGVVSGYLETTFSTNILASKNPTSYDATGLPPGLSVNTLTGVISGKPTVAGTFLVTMYASNSGGTGTVTQPFTIFPPPVIISAAASGTVGLRFNYNILTEHAKSIITTGLPPGLTSSGSTIFGTPTVAGTFNVIVNATNPAGMSTATLVLTIDTTPVITSASTAKTYVGTVFTYGITAINDPTSYDAIGLPAGLSVSTSTGLISGTPTEFGIFNITLSAEKAGRTGTKTLILTINSSPVIINQTISTGYFGKPFLDRIFATNSPTSFGALGLPLGLNLNPSTGLITGTPTVAGAFNVTYEASNPAGIGRKVIILTIYPAPVITSPRNATGYLGSFFNYVTTATNNPISYAAAGLPSGLNLNVSTGVISGMPNFAGTFNVSLTSINPAGTSGVNLVLTIKSPIVAPLITSGFVNTNEFEIRWSALSGITYQVESSSNLLQWTVAETNIVGVDGTMSWIDNDPGLGITKRRFYRIRVP
jgi:hypothetical protein